eukprot:scaffold124251_cov36-Tisochrysis_lutea.AAC.3
MIKADASFCNGRQHLEAERTSLELVRSKDVEFIPPHIKHVAFLARRKGFADHLEEPPAKE